MKKIKKIKKIKLNLDPWQKKFLSTTGDRILCTGRQVGKSTICGIDAGEWAINNKNKTILMIAPTERQAYALFEKTLNYILETKPTLIMKGRNRPTKSKISLHNGTIIWCLPTGLSGLGIRFLTVDRLYADEASRIPAAVWDAVTPMLLTTGGDTILLSTPFGTSGFFYEVLINYKNAFNDYTRFRIDSETVVRNRLICSTWSEKQQKKALERLHSEKQRMSTLAYAQEYMGQPLDDLKQVFNDKLLKEAMCLDRRSIIVPNRKYYLGQDIAGMGEDSSTWEIVDATDPRNIKHVENIVKKKIRTPERVRMTESLNQKYKFSAIGIDDGGLGSGDMGFMLESPTLRRKVVSLNNSRRNIDFEGKKSTGLLKEDLYNNLLALLEAKRLKLLKDDNLYHSLRSIQFEITNGRAKYSGTDSHIAEGLIRAVWFCRTKRLNIYYTSI